MHRLAKCQGWVIGHSIDFIDLTPPLCDTLPAVIRSVFKKSIPNLKGKSIDAVRVASLHVDRLNLLQHLLAQLDGGCLPVRLKLRNAGGSDDDCPREPSRMGPGRREIRRRQAVLLGQRSVLLDSDISGVRFVVRLEDVGFDVVARGR